MRALAGVRRALFGPVSAFKTHLGLQVPTAAAWRARDWPGRSFVELNAWLAERCRALWSEVRHPEHEQFSVAEMLEHERAQLMPMPEPFDGYVEKPARVSSTCLVSVARNRYSVPCEFAGQMVSTRLYTGSVMVVGGDNLPPNAFEQQSAFKQPICVSEKT
jgi:hypothetical protein